MPTILLGGNALPIRSSSSIWWHDILGADKGGNDRWLRSNIRCCVGDGNNIGFWRFKWHGNEPFSNVFPNLFAKEAY
jgi:hypothetical protein